MIIATIVLTYGAISANLSTPQVPLMCFDNGQLDAVGTFTVAGAPGPIGHVEVSFYIPSHWEPIGPSSEGYCEFECENLSPSPVIIHYLAAQVLGMRWPDQTRPFSRLFLGWAGPFTLGLAGFDGLDDSSGPSGSGYVSYPSQYPGGQMQPGWHTINLPDDPHWHQPSVTVELLPQLKSLGPWFDFDPFNGGQTLWPGAHSENIEWSLALGDIAQVRYVTP